MTTDSGPCPYEDSTSLPQEDNTILLHILFSSLVLALDSIIWLKCQK